MGRVIPPALLFAALACLLAFAPRPVRPAALARRAARRRCWSRSCRSARVGRAVFLGCWAITVATAAIVHLPRCLTRAAPLMLGINAGAWSGATVAIAGTTLDLARPRRGWRWSCPVRWLVATHRGVAVKVVLELAYRHRAARRRAADRADAGLCP